MMAKLIIGLLFILGAYKARSQYYDSAHIYAVYMKGAYLARLDRDIIKNEADPFILTDQKILKNLFSMLHDSVKGQRIRTKNKNPDLRLLVEFFKENKVVCLMGFTNQSIMQVNKTFYRYSINKLKFIRGYVPGVADALGIQ
jgi:hypothetical protein